MSLRLLCPNCREPLAPASMTCPNGHTFDCADGVLALLKGDFRRELLDFTTRLDAMRAAGDKRLLDASAYEQLPFDQAHRRDKSWRVEWRLRCYDLAVVLQLIGAPSRQRILDVGAWNGWLSQRLGARGHAVTAIDFFAGEYDGLRARQFYRAPAWDAIQMDLRDLSLLDAQFDVVILNHCLQFFPAPADYVAEAKRRVAPGGRLILIGLQFFHDPRPKARSVAAQQQIYRKRYRAELFLFPNKGYLDSDDRERLSAQGIALRSYPQLWLANLKAWLNPALPEHAFGVWDS